ncbi:MAG: hypothetical protein MJZ26_03870 [Fibrobacter sp.]|nr:hypothetical protein [Fibrobacter sp.]
MSGFKKFMPLAVKVLFVLVVSVCLSGCISHYVEESTSRLQVENATEDYSILAVDVVSMDGQSSKSWIKETVLPGERSRVVEEDWVGEFTLRFKYTKSTDGSGETLVDTHKFSLEGGSLYLVVESDGDSLTYRFR